MATASRNVLATLSAAAVPLASWRWSNCEDKVSSSSSTRPRTNDGKEVWFVQVVHRHGHRTPFAITPSMAEPGTPGWDATWGMCRVVSDPNKGVRPPAKAGAGAPLTADVDSPDEAGKTFSSCMKGGLTRRGENELYQLGLFLAEQYLIDNNPGIDPAAGPCQDTMKVMSTRTKRTILSARSLLNGMFPEAPLSELEKSVKLGPWGGAEIVIPNHFRCDRLRQLFFETKEQWENSITGQSVQRRIDSYREAHGGKERQSVIMNLDPAMALRGAGKELPEHMSEEFYQELKVASHEIVDVVLGKSSEELRRLSMGPLLRQMNCEFKARMDGSSQLRCVIRSAHDVSVTGVLTALGISTHGWPDFGSSVIIELLRDTKSGEFSVHIIMYDGVPQRNQKLVDMTVSFESWEKVLQPIAIDEEEYMRQCKLPPGVPTPPPHAW